MEGTLHLRSFLVFAVFFASCIGAEDAPARVFVAEQAQFLAPLPTNIEVPAGRYRTLPIPIPGRASALLKIVVTVRNDVFNDLSVYVCNELAMQQFARGNVRACDGTTRGRGSFGFTYRTEGARQYYLVLDNSYANVIKKKADVNVTVSAQLPKELVAQLQEGFEKLLNGIQGFFDVPAFDLAFRPCGEVNAFSQTSGGDITLCSELLFELLNQKMKGALEAVLFHELAHTLLNLWGLPNFDNEETADEFALVMLFWSGRQQNAYDLIRWYSKMDSRGEARHILVSGDRHPLSVQRVRNMERILANPKPVIDRWNRLVYSRLSESGLRQIADNPGAYHDRKLAQTNLAQRQTKH
jgi:hypothetical protein